MRYVAGFLFSEDREQVVLVEKIQPEWQRGRLNGVGGKVEPTDDSPTAAMVREFEEETGWLVREWEMFCQVKRRGDLTCFFRAFAEGSIEQVSGREAEEIAAYPVSGVAGLNTMANLGCLIPLALDGAAKNAIVEYTP